MLHSLNVKVIVHHHTVVGTTMELKPICVMEMRQKIHAVLEMPHLFTPTKVVGML